METQSRLISIIAALLLLASPGRSASLLTISKTPYEAFNCSMDFTPVAGSDGVTLVTVLSTNFQTGASTTRAMISQSPAPVVQGTSDVVVFRVQGGVAGQSHVVSVRVQDNVTGELFEGQVTLVIATAAGPN